MKPLMQIVKSFGDAFTFPLTVSHYMELVNPLWADHGMQARIEKIRDETQTTKTLSLRPGRNWRSFKPGQHVRVGIPIDGRHFTRTYSISTAAKSFDGCFDITIKAIPGGVVSNHIAGKTKVGDLLPVGIPQGEFFLPDAQQLQPLFITAGSGITPIMSMLRTLDQENRFPEVVHIHYAPRPSEAIFAEALSALERKHPRYRLTRIFTRGPSEDVRNTDLQDPHFSLSQLEQICDDWRGREVYACGPQSLLDSLETIWEAQGLQRNLHIERFQAKLATIQNPGKNGTVTFAESGTVVYSNGRSNLLRIAEDNGLNPDHGCRMGNCHSCDVRLVAGRVRDLRSNEVLSEPGQMVQICVCAPVGDAIIEI